MKARIDFHSELMSNPKRVISPHYSMAASKIKGSASSSHRLLASRGLLVFRRRGIAPRAGCVCEESDKTRASGSGFLTPTAQPLHDAHKGAHCPRGKKPGVQTKASGRQSQQGPVSWTPGEVLRPFPALGDGLN